MLTRRGAVSGLEQSEGEAKEIKGNKNLMKCY